MNLKFRKSIDSDLSLIVNYPEKENEFRITLEENRNYHIVLHRN